MSIETSVLPLVLTTRPGRHSSHEGRAAELNFHPAMSADIWMPLFIGDYLADTRRLDTEQHGAYLLLIMDYWKNGPPPDDDRILARIIGCTYADWRRLRKKVAPFFQISDEKWRHKRIDLERVRAKKNAEVFSERATKAANSRWNKDAPSNAPSIPSSNAQAMPPTPTPTPSLTLTSSSSPTPKEGVRKGAIALTRMSIPSIEELKLFCAKAGVSENDAIALWHKWDGNGWTNNGRPIKKWTSTIISWKNQGYLPSQKSGYANKPETKQRQEELHAPRL